MTMRTESYHRKINSEGLNRIMSDRMQNKKHIFIV